MQARNIVPGVPNTAKAKVDTFASTRQQSSNAYTLIAVAGVFVLAGQPAAPLHNYTLTAATGVFVVAGQAASPLHQSRLTASPGAFVLAGQPATETVGHRLPAAAGAFVLSGTAATDTVGHVLPAAAGAFVLSGQDATLTYTHGPLAYTLTAETGSFVLTGMDAALMPSSAQTTAGGGSGYYRYPTVYDPLPLRHYVLAAQPGRIQVHGQRALLLRGYTLAAEPGAFELIGQATTWRRTYQLAATSGQFAALGMKATAFRGVRSVWVTRTFETRSVQCVGTLARASAPPVDGPVSPPAPDVIDRAWSALQTEDDDELLLLGVIG